MHEITEELVPANLMHPGILYIDRPCRKIKRHKRSQVVRLDFGKGLVVKSYTRFISQNGLQSTFDANEVEIEGKLSEIFCSPPSSYVGQGTGEKRALELTPLRCFVLHRILNIKPRDRGVMSAPPIRWYDLPIL